jgi:aryl-phospho-beta-D-glucosidase BglC (GH1 family)
LHRKQNHHKSIEETSVIKTVKMAMEFLKVKRNQIITASGDSIRLRGFNAGGWLNMEDFVNGFPGAEHTLRETMTRVLGTQKTEYFFTRLLDVFFTEHDVKDMKRLGANVIRLPFNYRHFEHDDKPFEYLADGFARLDSAVRWCAKHGLYLILDFHAAQGWHNPDWHADSAHMQVLLYSHKQFEDRYAALWGEIAKRYKNEPTVAGYALLNEPVTRVEYESYDPSYFAWDGLNRVHRRAAEAIRRADKRHILFLEGDNFSSEYDGLDVTFDSQIVLSLHNYIEATDCEGKYPGITDGEHWDKARIAKRFAEHSGVCKARKHGIPMLVGEFGALHWQAGKQAKYRIKAVADQIDVYEEAGAHWAVWNYKDVGIRRGIFRAKPQSPYRKLVAPILQARSVFADWTNDSDTDTGRAIQQVMNVLDEFLAAQNIQPIERGRFKQYMMFGYNAHLLQTAYANLFKNMSETEMDNILNSFAIANCEPSQSYTEMLSSKFKAN